MIGEASGIAPDRGLNILYRVTMNTLMNLTTEGLTRDNYGANTQSQNNTRLGPDTPKGILAGQIITAGTTNGTVVACTGTLASGVLTLIGRPLGIAINNAVGYPFESSSGVGSGKCPYVHGNGTVIATDLYETVGRDGSTPIVYTPGMQLKCSQNGMLTGETGNAGDNEYAKLIVGVVLIAPTATDPFMVVQVTI